MTLQEIRHIAYTHPEQIEICWDKLDEDVEYQEQFEEVVTNALQMLPDLESLYIKLTSGKHVTMPDQHTTLPHDDVEMYTELVEEELFAAYQMEAMWDAYKKVINITKSGA